MPRLNYFSRKNILQVIGGDMSIVNHHFVEPVRVVFSITSAQDFGDQLVAGTSMRETTRIWKLNRKTVTRKMLHMGERAQIKLEQLNKKRHKSIIVEFDDLETFEHPKCKPVAVHSRTTLGSR